MGADWSQGNETWPPQVNALTAEVGNHPQAYQDDCLLSLLQVNIQVYTTWLILSY